jgi:hypothetical protein
LFFPRISFRVSEPVDASGLRLICAYFARSLAPVAHIPQIPIHSIRLSDSIFFVFAFLSPPVGDYRVKGNLLFSTDWREGCRDTEQRTL